jgi:hypothetical protein
MRGALLARTAPGVGLPRCRAPYVDGGEIFRAQLRRMRLRAIHA